MNHFIFNGVSSAVYGVIVEQPPEIQIGAIRATTQKVIGSAKLLHFIESNEAVEPVNLTLECALVAPTANAIDGLCAWLRGGGRLVVPGDEGHYYNAWIKNQIDLKKILRVRADRRFSVSFEREGFRYRYPEAEAIEMTAAGQLANPGTAPAEPLIKLYGSGDVTLMVDSTSLLINDVDGYVMIDCAAQLVYKGDVNWGAKVTRLGDWPRIAAAGSMLNWTGTVTKLEITPRWRDY
jgi:phage-related protein